MVKKYFVYCPDNGIEFFNTVEERDAVAEIRIRNWLDEGWSEEVEGVVAGEVTHAATKGDVVKRPDDSELDADLMDENGNYWDNDYEEMCNYKMLPIN